MTPTNRRGGVIVWDAAAAGDELPEDSGTARFPGARVQASVPVPWQTRAAVPPVRLGWAIVPPAGQ